MFKGYQCYKSYPTIYVSLKLIPDGRAFGQLPKARVEVLLGVKLHFKDNFIWTYETFELKNILDGFKSLFYLKY